MKPGVGQSTVHQLVEIIVMRELDVAAKIPREALVVYKRRGKAAGVRIGLENQEVGVSKLVQTVSGPRPVQPAPRMRMRGDCIR